MDPATLKNPEAKTSAPVQPVAAAPATSMRVALVEDDLSQAELLAHWLELAGHRCHQFDRGEELIRALDQESFDVVVLDWNLPDMSGVDVLKRIRSSRQAGVPIVFVTARNREDDVVTALRQGADDYMVKPVRRLELLARLETIARRGKHRVEQPEVLEVGVYRVDTQTRTVTRSERAVDLTAKDFDLSVLFLRNIGRLLSRGHIRESVWGPNAVVTSRTLDTHVSRIRNKLGLTPENGWRLAAVYRYGYRLEQLDGPQPRATQPPES
jgi:two-component system response regulator RegX3